MQALGDPLDVATQLRVVAVTGKLDADVSIKQLGDDPDDTRRREAPRPPT
jgi:hypothetical protein